MTSKQPDPFDDDYSEFEIESQVPPPPDTDAESSRDGEVPGEPEEGLLDQMLTSTDRLCCARGKGKSDDVETGNVGEGNLVPEAPATENGDNVENGLFTNEKGILEPDASAPTALARDPSAVKEAVEIKAHFDKDEDGITLISDNGLDTTAESEKIGSFVSEDQQPASRRRLQFILGGIAAFILIIGLGAGLGRKNNEQEASVANSASDEPPVNSPTLSPYVLVPVRTEDPVAETNATVVESPTEAPVEAPVGCVDSVSVDKSCYEFFNDEILATFNICDPVSQDWLALYPEGSNMTGLSFPQVAWEYTCGSQSCTGGVQQGTVSMGLQTAAGTYQAYLVSNAGGDQGAPYSAVAVSQAFEVSVGTCA